MFKLGVTGTRIGMNQYQRDTVRAILVGLLEDVKEMELHHGDCIGVDVQVAEFAKELGIRIVCHPPVDRSLRAFHKSDEFREEKTHFARNRTIVNETNSLLVIPKDTSPQKHGGTWYTHDYALKNNKPVVIIYPEEKYNEISEDQDQGTVESSES